jgi:hypothetical protein
MAASGQHTKTTARWANQNLKNLASNRRYKPVLHPVRFSFVSYDNAERIDFNESKQFLTDHI